MRQTVPMDPQRDTHPDPVRELKAKGYTDLDLFGMTHTLVAGCTFCNLRLRAAGAETHETLHTKKTAF